jgi:hypothetical protein
MKRWMSSGLTVAVLSYQQPFEEREAAVVTRFDPPFEVPLKVGLKGPPLLPA